MDSTGWSRKAAHFQLTTLMQLLLCKEFLKPAQKVQCNLYSGKLSEQEHSSEIRFSLFVIVAFVWQIDNVQFSGTPCVFSHFLTHQVHDTCNYMYDNACQAL